MVATLQLREQESGAPQADVYEDSVVRALITHRRAANTTMLPHFVRQAVRRAADRETHPRVATMLRVEASRAAQALGRLDVAEALLREASTFLPANAVDLLSAMKRQRVRLHLDRGEWESARRVAAEVDGMEFERVAGAPPMLTRSDEDIQTETWTVIAELALVDARLEDARAAIERGIQRLARDEEFRIARAASLGPFESNRLAVAASDLRHTLQMLDAVRRIRIGDPETGFDLLSILEGRVKAEENPDRQVLARLHATNGEWNPGGESAPRGIGLEEARRLHALVTAPEGVPLPGAGVVVEKPVGAAAHPPQAAPALPAADLPPGVAGDITAVFLEHLRRLSDATRPAAMLSDNFAFGGSFASFDIASMLCNGEQIKLTGFIHAAWPPAQVETTILAGRLHEGARAGEGYIFLREGLVVDATLGDYNPPPDAAADSDDARRSLVALLQIGLGIGLDLQPEGTARARISPGVGQRPSRLRVGSSAVMELITTRERELGLFMDDDAGLGSLGVEPGAQGRPGSS